MLLCMLLLLVLLLLSTVMSRMAQFISRRGPPPTGTFAGKNTGHLGGGGASSGGWSGDMTGGIPGARYVHIHRWGCDSTLSSGSNRIPRGKR
jgi:hypothetical protein